MRAISQDAVEAKDLGGTRSQARRNKKVLMVKSALYAAIGFAAISSMSLGGRPFFGDGRVAPRDIHDVSAL